MSTKSDRTQVDRPRVYAALVAITLAAAGVSLAISAPAWWPGHPRLDTPHPFGDMAAQTRQRREEQRQRLQEYRWRDREAGVVAIPIDRAMTLIVRESQEKERQP